MHKDRKAYNAYMRTYMLKRYHAKRKDYIKRLGGRCVKCGTSKNLEIDHKQAAKKKLSISGGLWSIRQDKIDKELKKCQLLCKSCHKEKSINDLSVKAVKRAGPIIHGSVKGYWRKCRRARCCTAAKKYRRSKRS